jgi:orotate phosphoribosyltransferase
VAAAEVCVSSEAVLKTFTDCEAILEGHFLLSSGRHSDRYLQCALVQQHPEKLATLCAELAGKWSGVKPTVVVGPAMGGIVFAYELARALGARGLFMERTENGFQLRRGFTITPEDRVLVAEDVVTTGKSVKEVLEALKTNNCKVLGVTSLVCRDAKVDFGVPYKALLTIEVASYEAQHCPLCRQGSKPVKPGSRPQPNKES